VFHPFFVESVLLILFQPSFARQDAKTRGKDLSIRKRGRRQRRKISSRATDGVCEFIRPLNLQAAGIPSPSRENSKTSWAGKQRRSFELRELKFLAQSHSPVLN
jgi:hypothetical protein